MDYVGDGSGDPGVSEKQKLVRGWKMEMNSKRAKTKNAKLLAAAPELLAAAIRVIFPDGGRDYIDGKESLARAIEKATGGD